MTEPGSPLVRHSLTTTVDLRGNWQSCFPKAKSLCVELACGRGEYTVELARRNPNINYLGIDIKGARIWQGATIALEEKLENVAFLRIRIEQIENYFSPGEIDNIWITFPDPFPSKANRRLTAPSFLSQYHQLLSPEGKIHFKTDDADLFDYSFEIASSNPLFRILYSNENIYAQTLEFSELDIKTYYERKHLEANKTIKYLQFGKIG